MKKFRRLWRFARVAALSLVIVLVLIVVVLHVQQHVLRHRAEHLLSDIDSLELRKATFAEAQIVFRRWQWAGRFVGDCSDKHCEFSISLRSFPFGTRQSMGRHGYLALAYMFVGGHPAEINADITVENAIVWKKSFGLRIEVPSGTTSGGPGDDGDWVPAGEYPLFALAESTSRLGPFGQPNTLHPEYEISRPGGCNDCVAGFISFTPYADPSDVSRLMQFNFSCLTRWKSCSTHSDIMPVAWAQHLSEGSSGQSAVEGNTCYQVRVEALGRDTENVAIVAVAANRKELDSSGKPFQISTLRLVDRLKRTAFWEIGKTREVRSLDEWIAPSRVRIGDRILLLFEHWETTDISLNECGVLPVTKENLEWVKRGIAKDYEAALPPQPN
jgi:hypothetical protein